MLSSDLTRVAAVVYLSCHSTADEQRTILRVNDEAANTEAPVVAEWSAISGLMDSRYAGALWDLVPDNRGADLILPAPEGNQSLFQVKHASGECVESRTIELLEHWHRLAKSLPDARVQLSLVLPASRVARATAQCVIRAAYRARHAVVHHQSHDARPIIAAFTWTWLGLRPTDVMIEATGNALLHTELDGTHPDGDHAAVAHLRGHVVDQHRMWRPIGETQLSRRGIDSLDRLAGQPGTTVADLAGGTVDQYELGFADPRIDRVLGRLARRAPACARVQQVRARVGGRRRRMRANHHGR